MDMEILDRNRDFYNKLMELDMELGTLINGEAVVDVELAELKNRVKPNTKAVVIQVGDNKASSVYVRNKLTRCKELGIEGILINLAEDITEEMLLNIISDYNMDTSISGILVQLPLPNHINEERISSAIKVEKDIDCFTSYNLGEVVKGNEVISPCTPRGVFTLLKHYNLDNVEGKTVVVVGRSNIVGKPLVNMLINRGATVINCNSKTPPEDIVKYMFSCDIFISAIGKANYFNLDFIEKYYKVYFDFICPVIIDIGINRDEDNKLCGDVSKDLRPYVNYITPVPGGVGKATVLELMRNIINSKDYEINK